MKDEHAYQESKSTGFVYVIIKMRIKITAMQVSDPTTKSQQPAFDFKNAMKKYQQPKQLPFVFCLS